MTPLFISRGLIALIDDDDVERVSTRHWVAKPVGAASDHFYAYHSAIDENGTRRTIYLHRFILSAPNGVIVDHINGIGLDCRKKNLRFATYAQNSANRRQPVSSAGKYRGVYKANNKYRASVGRGKTLWRSRVMTTAVEAALAYDAEVKRRYGAFAVLNFPDREEV